ncbi:MAG TPA: 16S rRNA (adenine(1518)-N(6)/adenine(1519)-N(6))-dimethyltransferase RsmA [Ktedonobacterales bacterium]|nr:16S rRNA (adenine(1518)-N(6)/adenine(1519)-N(6))-dimethyltransferase RsmA [Ktedonobacterales bacterium]
MPPQIPPELHDSEQQSASAGSVPDLSNPAVVRRLLQKHGARPQKTFGQYWLEDREALRRIVEAAELTPGASALEVGAGMGVLTVALAQAVGPEGRVIAVEIERDVLAILREVTEPLGNVEILPRNLLEVEPRDLFQGAPYALVANLPYYITASALRHFLECDQPPQRLVVLVQQEVAERMTAKPGALSLLGVSVQFYGQAQLIARVPASSFYPPPRVDSAVVRVDVYPEPPLAQGVEERERFFQVVRAGFSQKRKTLRNSLALGLDQPPAMVEAWLRAANIDPQRRAETLALEEWGRLAQVVGSEQAK